MANRKSASVTAIDLADFHVSATIPVPPGPSEIAVRSPAGDSRQRNREIYIVSTSGVVSVVDFSALRITAEFNVGSSALALNFQRDGHRAFVLAPGEGDLLALNCDSHQVDARLHLSPGLSGLAISSDGNTLVAANGERQELYFVNAGDLKLRGELNIGAQPVGMGIVPGGSKIYFGNAGERKITAVDVSRQVLLARLEANAIPSTLIFKPDGGEIFVLSGQGSNLTIVDAFHDEIEQSPFTTGPNPTAAILRGDASVLYIATADDGNIMALDAPDRQPMAYIHIGIRPSALALTPDERFLLVADSGSSSLAVVRTDRNTLVTTIPVGEAPVSVVVPPWERR